MAGQGLASILAERGKIIPLHREVEIAPTEHEGLAVVSSRDLAECFGKLHKNVLRNIEEVLQTLENGESSELSPLFLPSTYTTETSNGAQYKEYLLTQEGFMLIAMGFTGSKATQYKLKIIQALQTAQQEIDRLKAEAAELHRIATEEKDEAKRIYEADKIKYAQRNIASLLEDATYKDVEEIAGKIIDVHSKLKLRDRYKYHQSLSRTQYKQQIVKHVISKLEGIISTTDDPLKRTVAQQINTDLHKRYIQTLKRQTGQIIALKDKEIDSLTAETAPPIEEFNLIHRHGFTCNSMYTYNFKRTSYYKDWINNFDFDSVWDRGYWRDRGVDFAKPIELYVYYTCKDTVDVNNLDKSFIDMLFNRIFAIDDSIVTSVVSKKIASCDTYKQGKIQYYIRNV